MKKQGFLLAAVAALMSFFFAKNAFFNLKDEHKDCEAKIPNDYLYLQRAYPYASVPSEAYYTALEWANGAAQQRNIPLNWQPAGPTNVGGRITDLAMHPTDLQTIYAATASGGVWKSVDMGYNWSPISDQLPSLSIGDIALDPADKNTLYVGTGETNGGGGSVTYDGRGLFRSSDAGATWTALGLENTGSIGRIEVSPENPNRIFVAAMGRLFGNNPERGVFRSDDGGASWQKTLFVNDSTGAIDLAIHPLDPDTVFAVTWERTRRPNKRVYGGPGCAIWRSTDGGDTWAKLSVGLPNTNIGRIGIALSPSQPSTLYAIYADQIGFFKDIYKSDNLGDTWAQMNNTGDPNYASFGWWFGQIRVHPTQPNEAYALGVDWTRTTNGGTFWSEAHAEYLHADYHALYIHPADPDFRVVGNDGGIYVSFDGGGNWGHRPLPITQFYTSEIDFQNPNNFYGGTQDNGTWRTLTGDLDDWEQIGGGDGFVTLVNPTDNNIYYVESQYGGFYGTNGATAPNGTRFNWNSPYIFAPNNPDILYFGAERVFKSSNGGLTWSPISGDLSNGPTGQNGMVYGTVTTLAASPVAPSTLFAGTDDGNVWVSTNDGQNWTKISTTLPKRWVTRVVADPWDANTAYVCLSGFRHFEDIAHIYKTTDLGQTWLNVSGNLPDVPVNDLTLDPLDPDYWYIATDAGVFSTSDGGGTWESASAGLPTVPVLDLTLHAPTRSLAAATYGRSMFRTNLPLPSSVNFPQTVDNVAVAPNPFVEQTVVSFYFSGKNAARVEVFDGSGKRVRTLHEGPLAPGQHQFVLASEGLAKGIYFLRISAGEGREVCRKILRG
jgi:photosystem II stability/assembly factor-like uncharacterized protein